VIHEQNAIPGMTNQWLARIAVRVLEAFPGSFPAERGAQALGNPVRRDIAELDPPQTRFQGRTDACRVLVIGGSLGATALNESLPEALALLAPERRPQVRHQAGRGKLDAARKAYDAAGVEAEVSEFLDDMAGAYAWADLVVCRSGALTVTELAAVGIGSILVPFPHAVDDHQTHNARYLTESGAGVLIPQNRLDKGRLAELLAELCADRPRLLSMAQAARRLARPDAAERVADICEQVAA
jgi:UDP-N-acetylglucosamine--N-acetylmuramyl-(pentapeptide) pyrophosphoryl-undecaprenol N-acetylglucosamine transferase